MADRSVVIKLGLNATGLVAGARTAEKSLQGVGARGLNWVGKNEQSINTLTNGVGALGLAAVAAAGLAVRSFANFDEAMSHVAATGEDARGSIDALRQAALDAGARTQFSATEAAGAIEELAKAGVSAADILAGGLDGALDLAAAGGIEVAEAAEIAATAIKVFGLAGDDMAHVADLLAAGAGKAQGGVTEMGAALKQAALVADQTGLSIEETTAGLAAFASAGLLGSDAGTSFKAMLQRLTPQSKEAADKMAELGISAYDSQGNFIGLAQFAGNLQTALHDLTPEQRNSALATIFGSDAVRAASVLYEAGETDIRKWITAVDDQGYAAETAATRMDNLKGDLEQFMGALETALIGAGEGANGPLRSLVQNATEAVNTFNDLSPAAQQATLAIVGGGGLVALGVAGLGKLIIGFNNAKAAVQALGFSMRGLTLAGGAIGIAIGVAGYALSSFLSEKARGRQIVEDFTTALEADSGAFGENAAAAAAAQIAESGLADAADKAGVSFELAARAATGNKQALDQLNGIANGYNNQLGTLQHSTGAITEADRKRAEILLTQYGAIQDVLGITGDLTGKWDEARQKYEDGETAINVVNEALGVQGEAAAGAGVAQQQLGQDFDDTTEGIQTQTEALVGLVEQLQAAGLLALSTRDAQRNLEQAIDDATTALTENGSTLDVTTEKGRDNQAALDDIASSTHDLISALAEQGASEKDLQGVMRDSRAQFIATATQMGLTRGQARRLADQLGLIPGNYEAVITADDQASGTLSEVDRWLNSLDGKSVAVRIDAIWDRITTPPTGLSFFPGNARGADSWRGGLTWVGEEGPELVNLPRGTAIHSAQESRQMASTATLVPFSPSSVTSTAPAAAPEFDVRVFIGDRELTDIVDMRISERDRGTKRGSTRRSGAAR